MDYPHQIPRHVHGPDGVSKIVRTVEECETALNVEGYKLLPFESAAEVVSEQAYETIDPPKPVTRGRKPKA